VVARPSKVLNRLSVQSAVCARPSGAIHGILRARFWPISYARNDHSYHLTKPFLSFTPDAQHNGRRLRTDARWVATHQLMKSKALPFMPEHMDGLFISYRAKRPSAQTWTQLNLRLCALVRIAEAGLGRPHAGRVIDVLAIHRPSGLVGELPQCPNLVLTRLGRCSRTHAGVDGHLDAESSGIGRRQPSRASYLLLTPLACDGFRCRTTRPKSGLG
jgi:hypothetical protein